MSSPVSICSQSLVRLGDESIASFNEGNGPTCEELFPQVKLTVETFHAWRFNTKKSESLPKSTTTPPSQYKYSYDLPPDMLNGMPRAVWNTPSSQGTQGQFTDFNIFETKLLSSTENIYIDYQYPTNVEIWPVHAVELLIRAMMAVLAFPVVEKQEIVTATTIDAWGKDGKTGYARVASRIDDQGHPAQSIQNFPLIDVRHGGY